LRRGLALSRNIVTIKVAEMTGYDRVANLWKRIGVRTTAALAGAVDRAAVCSKPRRSRWPPPTRCFTNGGSMRPLQGRHGASSPREKTRRSSPNPTRSIARADTTYLVTNMMRSVMTEGTASTVKVGPNPITVDVAGKTGTTNDQRDAWFVGFTPELLTVVWVGFDNNQPIGPERRIQRHCRSGSVSRGARWRHIPTCHSAAPTASSRWNRQGDGRARHALIARRRSTRRFLAGTGTARSVSSARRHVGRHRDRPSLVLVETHHQIDRPSLCPCASTNATILTMDDAVDDPHRRCVD
jgi:membrane peptidoglycan carboxypeptidase